MPWSNYSLVILTTSWDQIGLGESFTPAMPMQQASDVSIGKMDTNANAIDQPDATSDQENLVQDAK